MYIWWIYCSLLETIPLSQARLSMLRFYNLCIMLVPSVGVKRFSILVLSLSWYHWSVLDSCLHAPMRHSIRNLGSLAFTLWRLVHFVCHLTYRNNASTSEVQQCEAFEFRADSYFLEKTRETIPIEPNRCPFIHSFHFYYHLSCSGSQGYWKQSQQSYGEDKVAPWTNHHFVIGFHRRSKNIQSRPKTPHMHEAGAPREQTHTSQRETYAGLKIKATSSSCVVTMLTAATLCHS